MPDFKRAVAAVEIRLGDFEQAVSDAKGGTTSTQADAIVEALDRAVAVMRSVRDALKAIE